MRSHCLGSPSGASSKGSLRSSQVHHFGGPDVASGTCSHSYPIPLEAAGQGSRQYPCFCQTRGLIASWDCEVGLSRMFLKKQLLRHVLDDAGHCLDDAEEVELPSDAAFGGLEVDGDAPSHQRG